MSSSAVVSGLAHIAGHLTGHLTGYVLTHGVVATAMSLAPLAIAGTAIIGGIVWTQEKVDHVNKIVKALANNDAVEAGKQLIKLSDILGLGIDETAVKVGELLDQKYDRQTVREVRKTIQAISGEIQKAKKANTSS